MAKNQELDFVNSEEELLAAAGANTTDESEKILVLHRLFGRSDQRSFVYDPHDPVPTTGGANIHFFRSNLGVKDQREVERRRDVLVFTSPPLEKPIQIVGPIAVTLFAATDATDTDFSAKLVEVRSDGYARIIEDGIVRGRKKLRLV